MDTKFLLSINRILGHEGGYVNNPKDPGGETNWGISKRSYPSLNIKTLTRDGAIKVYYRDFWQKLSGGEFSDGVGFQLLDSAVNSGIQQSVRFAQRAVGVADDGVFGAVSAKAMQQTTETDFIMKFLSERLDFMTRLKAWDSFGRGWARRIAQNLKYGSMDS